MNSLTDLREVVDVVIGVDTHVHTHSAAVIDTATGGVLDEITVEATAEGYAELVEFANQRAARHNGAKSDPLDAIRAAREAMARPQLGTPPHRGRTPSPVSALGCSPLRDQCLHRGPTAGLQPGHRRTRTHPSQVPRPEARRDAQHAANL